MSSLNPMTNRWAAAFMVGAVLLAVAELVGTDEQAGVLSQAVGNYGKGDGEVVSDEVSAEASPAAVEIVEDEEETPEEDLPQLVEAASPEIVDASEQIAGDGGEELPNVDDGSLGDTGVEDDGGE